MIGNPGHWMLTEHRGCHHCDEAFLGFLHHRRQFLDECSSKRLACEQSIRGIRSEQRTDAVLARARQFPLREDQ